MIVKQSYILYTDIKLCSRFILVFQHLLNIYQMLFILHKLLLGEVFH